MNMTMYMAIESLSSSSHSLWQLYTAGSVGDAVLLESRPCADWTHHEV